MCKHNLAGFGGGEDNSVSIDHSIIFNSIKLQLQYKASTHKLNFSTYHVILIKFAKLHCITNGNVKSSDQSWDLV